MFWDNVAGVYDIFANIINRKTHRGLCAKVENEISITDEVLECACGTGLLSGVIAEKCNSLIATDFKRQFTYDTYKEFIKEAGYENVEYSLIEGKIPCAIAVITKK